MGAANKYEGLANKKDNCKLHINKPIIEDLVLDGFNSIVLKIALD
jgi:hypothetical protein